MRTFLFMVKQYKIRTSIFATFSTALPKVSYIYTQLPFITSQRYNEKMKPQNIFENK